MDFFTFNKGVLKTSCKCKSSLIRSPKLVKRENQPTLVEREGGGEGGGGGVEIAHYSDIVFVKYWWH